MLGGLFPEKNLKLLSYRLRKQNRLHVPIAVYSGSQPGNQLSANSVPSQHILQIIYRYHTTSVALFRHQQLSLGLMICPQPVSCYLWQFALSAAGDKVLRSQVEGDSGVMDFECGKEASNVE